MTELSIRKGLGFGLASGIITTLGLIVGLHSGTHSRTIILGSILVIAIADSLSDALGIHISEESGRKDATHKHIWVASISTFISKLVIALTFLVPIYFLELKIAIIVSIIWGILLLSIFSIYISKRNNLTPYKAVLEHLFIATFVIIVTHYVGVWVSTFA